MERGHAPHMRVPQALVDVQGRYVGPVADQSLAGEDEVEVEVDQDAAEAGMRGLVHLGERVVEEDQPGVCGAVSARPVKCAAAAAKRTR